jgi:3-oxoacyl-[acyl-carrier protein] reductase/(S)-1-phenylethanol dehydrogenase
MGRVHAETLAAQGADVAIGDPKPADATLAAIEAHGRRGFAGSLDVSSEDSVAAFVAATVERFGRIDILINNAGIYPFQSFDDMAFADWRRVMAVDLDGPFLMCKAVVPHMRAAKYGRIVNVASAECWMLASDNLHYIAAKMGVIGLTRALATEAAADGITVNAIAPGIVADTSINSMMPKYLELIPQNLQAIKRPAEPQDLADAAAFLASDEARFITGQTLIVDGGAVRL